MIGSNSYMVEADPVLEARIASVPLWLKIGS